jgi:hypothetical protein
MRIDFAVNGPSRQPRNMCQDANRLKGRRIDWPTAHRGKGQPDQAGKKRNVDRKNANLNFSEHPGLQ